MKARLFLFVLLVSITLLSACKNEAKNSFDRLSKEIDNIELSNIDQGSVENLLSRIETHLAHYPNYKQNNVLIQFKEEITYRIEDNAFKELMSSIEQIEGKTYQDYETAIKSFEATKQALNEYIASATIANNIQTAKSKIEEIGAKLNYISYEQNDYFNVINANSVSELEAFVSKYPNSVMRNTVYEKIDEVYYAEFIEGFNASPRSISGLNTSAERVKNFIGKFRSVEAKTKLSELLANLETQRTPVLESELEDNLQVLIERMENEARNKAEHTRSAYTVEMCVARSSNPEIVGYSSNFERLYQVNMKGAFLGIDKRELMIVVSGRIKGNVQNGVSISITGSRVQSDRKL